jgi:hypothetical protein
MASIKCTYNCSGVFPKLKIIVVFLKFAKIAMAFIQLTLSEIHLCSRSVALGAHLSFSLLMRDAFSFLCQYLSIEGKNEECLNILALMFRPLFFPLVPFTF